MRSLWALLKNWRRHLRFRINVARFFCLIKRKLPDSINNNNSNNNSSSNTNNNNNYNYYYYYSKAILIIHLMVEM